MKQRSLTKRVTTMAFAVTGLFAMSMPSAQSAIPPVINGQAYSEAMKVVVTIPSVAQVRQALLDAGYPVTAMPALDLGATSQTLVISSNYGDVTRTNATGAASSWAAPLLGDTSMPKSSSRCDSTSCADEASLAKTRIELPAPLALGSVDVAGALSRTTGNLRTQGTTGIVDIGLKLESLIGEGAALAAVGNALNTVRTTVNGSVLPVVNNSIDTVKSTLDGITALKPIKDELDRVITVGNIKPLPDIRTADLISGRVLAGAANLSDEPAKTLDGLRATSLTQIVDLGIFGGWVTADSIEVKASAFANGVKGEASAKADSKTDVVNLDVGGLLGVHVSSEDLARLLDPKTLKDAGGQTLENLGLGAAVTELENALDLAYGTAGITLEKLANEEKVSPAGTLATATANSLRLRIAPALPNYEKLMSINSGGSVIPKFTKSDFTPSGLSITVDLPSATAAVAATNVKPVCIGSCVPKTGVESKAVWALALLGLAVGVRRFALGR
ncbi:MAG: hypothetical protein ACLGH3_09395 [Actinomycetota bacterium]